jgi:hypothetical protein
MFPVRRAGLEGQEARVLQTSVRDQCYEKKPIVGKVAYECGKVVFTIHRKYKLGFIFIYNDKFIRGFFPILRPDDPKKETIGGKYHF